MKRNCIICGKEFYIKSERCLKKTCCEECRQKHLRSYNSQWVKENRVPFSEMSPERRATHIRASKRSLARLRFEKRLWQAKQLIELAQLPHAEEIIAYYIDKNLIKHGSASREEYASDIELSAKKIFEENAKKVLTKY